MNYSGIVEIDHHFYVSAQYTLNTSWKRTVLSPSPIVEPKRLQRAPTLLLTGSRVENLRQILVMIRMSCTLSQLTYILISFVS